jgi:hypothetical protein
MAALCHSQNVVFFLRLISECCHDTVRVVVAHQLPSVAWAHSRYCPGPRYPRMASWRQYTERASVLLQAACSLGHGIVAPTSHGRVGDLWIRAVWWELTPGHVSHTRSGYDRTPIYRLRQDLDGAEPRVVM